ncbi:MAG: hypothetical protein R3E69_13785 [Steroidobacteraceae bacterium]
MQRAPISSGSSFEQEIACSRAFVQGDWVFVSGTTGFDYSTMTIAEGLEAALHQAGADLADAVRVTYVLPDDDDIRETARSANAHRDRSHRIHARQVTARDLRIHRRSSCDR